MTADQELRALREENLDLRRQLENLRLQQKAPPEAIDCTTDKTNVLTSQEYRRYGRQLLVPQFSMGNNGDPIKTQCLLKNAKILVVGAGGLGCPALLYLAAAGVGNIDIIDPDVVEESNLHRQVLHSTSMVGRFKAESAKQYLQDLNPLCNINTYTFALDSSNATERISEVDLVLDCTDKPMTRYLINDAAVICKKTIVSGSGIKTDGQLSILNYVELNGPCYRCFYPKPASPHSVKLCSDGGVIGACIGLVGTMMAIETIKVLTRWYDQDNFKPYLSMFSGYNDSNASLSLRTFKMRGKQQKCLACSGIITKDTIRNIDYNVFCGTDKDLWDLVDASEQVTPKQYHDMQKSVMASSKDDQNQNQNQKPILVDCRPVEHYNIVHLPESIHVPLDTFENIETLDELNDDVLNTDMDVDSPVFVICRYGNHSRKVTRLLKDKFGLKNVKDVAGGLYKYSSTVDSTIPIY